MAANWEALALKHSDRVREGKLSPDGLATIQEALALKHPDQVKEVKFSPDGRYLASFSELPWMMLPERPQPSDVRVWDLATGREAFAFKCERPVLNFSPDGRWIASVSPRDLLSQQPSKIKIWNLATGQEAFTFECSLRGIGPIVAFSPDGRRLGCTSGEMVRIWDTATWQEALALKHAAPVFTMTFSPDSKRIATTCFLSDQTVRIWDVDTGQEVLVLKGPSRDSLIMFSPDGKRLLAVGRDKTVMV